VGFYPQNAIFFVFVAVETARITYLNGGLKNFKVYNPL
jgi:hypothetical protein